MTDLRRPALAFGWLVSMLALVPSTIPGKDAPDAKKADKHRTAIKEFLAGPIQTLEITVSDEDLEALRKDPRRYVEGQINDGKKVHRGVAVKLKGAEGSFQPVDSKPCFTINTDKYKGGDRFHGFKKFHLNNAREDASFLRQMICGEMASVAGVPALRCTHALVKLNGRDLGLYVLAEGYTKDFLSEFFQDPEGDLYESGFCKDIDEDLTKDQGDPKDFKAIESLIAACREDNAAERWNKLTAILDPDRFANFLAFESSIGVGDGYDFFRNNYRIYHDPGTRLLSFIPHGMDQPLSDAGFPILRSPDSMVGRAFVSCPQGRALYREHAAKLYAKVWEKRDWAARIDEVAGKLKAAIGPERSKRLADPIANLRSVVAARGPFIAQSINSTPTPLKFDAQGIARLTNGWVSKREGEARFDRTQDDRGQKYLRIVARGQAQASWRTPLQLDAGRYRFEAKVKTTGVRDGEGVCLRISGQDPQGEWIAGDSGWKLLHFEFEVPDEQNEVVLVAELRAARGEVWFAADSLQISRTR